MAEPASALVHQDAPPHCMSTAVAPRIGTACSLVPGAEASGLLRICDPRGLLAVADSVEVALAAVQHQLILDHGSARAS